VTYRKIVSDVLAELPMVEVVGSAANGKIALDKTAQLHPDLLVLDVEMPEVDGLEVLRRLKSVAPAVGAIMLSAFTAQGAQTTVTCLELGAFDFVLKPSAGTLEENVQRLRSELRPRLAAYARKRDVQTILGQTPARSTRGSQAPSPVSRSFGSPDMPAPRGGPVPEVVAIGISTGGPKALSEMLPRLPADFPVPIVIVQHMPPVFTKSLADDLNRRCPLRVREAEDRQVLGVGDVLFAPGGTQMKVRRDGECVRVAITDDPPENSCKPAADYLFRSVVQAYGGSTLGVIMTGMGSDGTAGCRLIKQAGGRLIAQDAASCVVYGMPRGPIEEGLADVVAPLDRIASEMVRALKQGVHVACR
jgi:two-component system chemotaxis response regulator CheB